MSFLSGGSGSSGGSMSSEVSITDIFAWMRSVLNAIVRPTWTDPTNGTVRVTGSLTTAGTVSTVTTVTTVSTVSNQSNIGGFDAKFTELYDMTRSNWSANVRSRIV